MSPRQSRGRPGRSGEIAGDGSAAEPPEVSIQPEPPEGLIPVLESAARLQQVVPDAVLVGGTMSAAYAGHRLSFDHDHVLALQRQYDVVLEAVEATQGWATSVRASKPPMTLMGELGGIEAGLRQLRRTTPLQTQRLRLPDGSEVTIPTIEEALRVKAYLIVQRNQVRDYLDVAALADRMGIPAAARVLGDIDHYYRDRSGDPESVASDLVERLARPQPRDTRTISDLARYKGLVPRWQDWAQTRRVLAELAQAILEHDPSEDQTS